MATQHMLIYEYSGEGIRTPEAFYSLSMSKIGVLSHSNHPHVCRNTKKFRFPYNSLYFFSKKSLFFFQISKKVVFLHRV